MSCTAGLPLSVRLSVVAATAVATGTGQMSLYNREVKQAGLLFLIRKKFFFYALHRSIMAALLSKGVSLCRGSVLLLESSFFSPNVLCGFASVPL